jgi:chemotaxis methyl-accepting protein methylase
MTEPLISEQDFEKFREFFYRKTGIQFEHSKRYFVDKRLIERIECTAAAASATTSRCCVSRLPAKSCST